MTLRPAGWWFTLLVAICAFATPVAAELGDEQRVAILGEAQAAYDEGVALLRSDPDMARTRFREAAAKYSVLVSDGVSNGLLFYDLGNAYLQADELGRAILNYRRAERLLPTDGRVAANLAHARTLRHDQLPEEGTRALLDALLFWRDAIGSRWRLAIAIGGYALFWCLLAVRTARRQAPVRLALAGSLVVAALFGSSFLPDVFPSLQRVEGVLIADDVEVRKGDGEGFELRFEEPLHQGVEFVVLEQRGEWMRIELPTGEDGWIRAKTAGVV